MVVDISEYKVGVVVGLEDIIISSSKTSKTKTLKLCSINIGQGEPVPVVTSAPNVRLESRVVVALAGSTVVTNGGELIKLQPTLVGGKLSHGMLCDSKMLGWSGGAAGVAVHLPPPEEDDEDFEVGTAPPSQKPRPKGISGGEDTTTTNTGDDAGLFERKLSEYDI
jgi:tRNA-binding EMAP/Myf-like protein